MPPARGRLHPRRHRSFAAGSGRRCSTQLPARGGGRRGRELPRVGRVGVRGSHQAGPRARSGPGGRADARLRHGHGLRWSAGRGEALHRGLGCVGGREGRLRAVHAQGDRRAAAGCRRLPARPDHEGGPHPAGRDGPRRGRAPHGEQGRRHRLRHGGARRNGRQVRDRALDPAAGRDRAGQRVPLPRSHRRPGLPRDRDLAVRRDDGHPHGPALREGAGGSHAGHLQHGGLDHPARVGRGPLHLRRIRRSRSRRRRHSSRRSSPPTSSACTWRRHAARCSRTRSEGS